MTNAHEWTLCYTETSGCIHGPLSTEREKGCLKTRALSTKKIQLQKLGKGQKPKAAKAISADDENLMWEEGQLGDSSPRTLIFSVWYYFTKCFGLRGRNEHRQLFLGDVVLKKDPVNGREFLEYSEQMTTT